MVPSRPRVVSQGLLKVFNNVKRQERRVFERKPVMANFSMALPSTSPTQQMVSVMVSRTRAVVHPRVGGVALVEQDETGDGVQIAAFKRASPLLRLSGLFIVGFP